MAVDVDEFAALFGPPSPVDTIKEVFGVPEPELKPKELKWKGKVTTVYDYELFKSIIKGWMEKYGYSKEEALDEFFDMF